MSIAGYEYGGQYKTADNVILEVDAQGHQRVRFRPTLAAETPQAMEQLELAYLAARNDANINQLLLIPCVILDFLCIHPFRDGNGRCRGSSLCFFFIRMVTTLENMFPSRNRSTTIKLTTMMPCSSLRGLGGKREQLLSIIENFLSMLYMCYKELDKRFAVVHGKKITKKRV